MLARRGLLLWPWRLDDKELGLVRLHGVEESVEVGGA